MTLAFDHPGDFDSPLARFDPRWKLAALIGATLAVAFLQTWPAAGGAFGGALVLAILGRLPWRWFCFRLFIVTFFLALFLVWLPFVHEGPTWDLGPLELSRAGIILALALWLKALAMVTLMLVLWTTAPFGATLKAAHALYIPDLIIHLVVLTYRYLYLLAEELGRLRIALRVRGYRHRADLHSYRTVAHVSGTLLVRSYERAERVAQAMHCRGFDGRFRSLADFHTRWYDVAFFLLMVMAATALLCWDLVLR